MEDTTSSHGQEPAKKPRWQLYRERHPERYQEQNKKRNQRNAESQRQWREDHKEHYKAVRKAHKERHLEEIRAENREYSHSKRVRNRMEVLNALGGKCNRCGIDDWRVLQIDHVNGGGTQERKQVTSIDRYYKDMLLSPEKYQALCANCHQIKRYEERKGRGDS